MVAPPLLYIEGMTRGIYSLLLLVLLSLAACGRQSAMTIDSFAAASASDSACSSHAVGVSFAAADGCNTCTCQEMADGSVAQMCTQIACLSH